MEQTLAKTFFASAERAEKQWIVSDNDRICSLPFLTSVLEAMPHIVFVLNEYRQVVFANQVFYDAFGVDSVDLVLGLRPGEAIGCCHSSETAGGCGTTKACRTCGAVLAILNSLEGNADTRECRVVRKEDNQAFDLMVKAVPLQVEGKQFVIASAVDISHEKRRRILERIFFHDITNTIIGLKGVSGLLSDLVPKRLKKIKSLAGSICNGVSDLIENISAQKDLSDAESNELIVKPTQISSLKILEGIKEIYKCHPVAKNRSIEICPSTQDIEFVSDVTLLSRSLGNLTKNALEASGNNDIVTIGCNVENGFVQFRVHNPTVIPEEVRHQIFQRSFSTKGRDRGLGTYSIKLLVEKYLNGSVSFTSNIDEKTTFEVSLPLSLESINK